MKIKTTRKHFNLIVIGSGGSGLMSAISASESGLKNIAIISKVFPFSSHTVAAKGGINAALGNVMKDDWKWHAYDTLKSGDYLADNDAVEIICKNAKDAILYLEKIGVAFCRDENNKISQRAYGAQTTDFGNNKNSYRACYVKDKTGHSILNALYQQSVKHNIDIFSEFLVIDLLIKDNICYGCVALDLNEGQLVIFEADNVIIASGGYSQIYQNTTSSTICCGDLLSIILENNLPLQDMEFIQFHPTGIANIGFLITEAARGEGAYLLNKDQKRFMEHYAPNMMELASRDIISQAMAREIHENKGAGPQGNYLYLDMRHISDDVLANKLPGIVELVEKFLNLNLKNSLIPVAPSAHYTMGGIPVNVDCEVLDEKNQKVEGLLAVGEAACLSVHGANRLGCNSLLELIVFGKIAGKTAAISKKPQKFDINSLIEDKIANFEKIFSKDGAKSDFSLSEIKIALKNNNEKNLSVFRDEKLLNTALENIKSLYKQLQEYKVANKSLIFNEEIVEFFELKALILNSLATTFSAVNRKESRGAHFRSDYLSRNDKDFCVHSLVKFRDLDNLEFIKKKVFNKSEIPELNLTIKDRKY